MKKRVLSLFLAVCMTLTLLPSTAWASEPGDTTDPTEPVAQAANTVNNGTCGENLIWTLDDAGTLTISSTGPMTDYAGFFDVPLVQQPRSDSNDSDCQRHYLGRGFYVQ